MLQTCHALVANKARNLKISILFANRTVEDILCKDLLDELAKDPRVSVSGASCCHLSARECPMSAP